MIDAFCGFVLVISHVCLILKSAFICATGKKTIVSDWPLMQLSAVTAARKPGVELTSPDVPCESYVVYGKEK